MGSYGYDRPTSPHIDELAAEGHVFETVVVQRALTGPSLASMMTSLYPFQHGVRGNGIRHGFYARTLASFLKERGYATAVFSGNHVNTPLLGFDLAYGAGELGYIEGNAA